MRLIEINGFGDGRDGGCGDSDCGRIGVVVMILNTRNIETFIKMKTEIDFPHIICCCCVSFSFEM